MYQYNAKILQVYDGDTFTAEVDLGFNHSFVIKLRLYGVDTPELRGDEKEEGRKVRDLVRGLILGKNVVLNTYKDGQGKYGRYLAEIFLENGITLNNWLIENGHARPYP